MEIEQFENFLYMLFLCPENNRFGQKVGTNIHFSYESQIKASKMKFFVSLNIPSIILTNSLKKNEYVILIF